MDENDKQERVVPGDVTPVTPEELQMLKEERDGLQDRLLRKHAELENYKKRVERERTEFVQFASSELMKEILGVLDSFELALRNSGGDIKGFELIHKQLQDTLARFGLKAVEVTGQKFDPNLHQAVATQPAAEVE